MKTYVINLPRATERRAAMESQLANSGLDYEFVDGVDGQALTSEQRAELVDEAGVGRYSWWSTPGMIGCVLSHKKVYDLMVEREDPCALVLEDDMALTPALGALVDALPASMVANEVVLLNFRSCNTQPCKLERSRAVDVEGHSLMRCATPELLVSSGAYLLDLQAATGLAAWSVPVKAGPDIWGLFLDEHVIGSVRCVMPRPATEHRVAMKSFRAPDQTLTLRQKITHAPIWPLPQLRALNRQRISRSRLKVELI